MAINFPSGPSTGQIYTYGQNSWQWTGEYWSVYSAQTGYITSVTSSGNGFPVINSVGSNNLVLKSFSGDSNVIITDSAGQLNFSIDIVPPYNAGTVSGATWTNAGGGAITLPTVKVALYNNANFIKPIYLYTVNGGTTGIDFPALTNNDTNYIVIDYNNGSPVFNVLTDNSTINSSNIVLYMIVYRANNFVHTLEFGNEGAGLPNKLNDRVIATGRFARESGLLIGLSGNTGVVTLSSGVAWNGVNRQSLMAVDSYNDVFFKNYHSGGTWVYSTTGKTLNNTYYDNGINIVTATTGYYLTNWYYRGQEINDHIYEVFSTNQYPTIAAAQLATIPTVPELISSHAFLFGRIIVGVGKLTGLTESAFVDSFQQTQVTLHNDLNGIQGGSAGEYYHVNASQYNSLAFNNVDNNFSTNQTINGSVSATGFSGGTFYGDGSGLINLTPAGTDGAIQFNNGGFLAGNATNFRYQDGTGGFFQGDNVAGGGDFGHAQGSNTIAQGFASHAEGVSTNATGYYSHAEGSGTTTNGIYSHTEGLNTVTWGDNSHAEGKATKTGMYGYLASSGITNGVIILDPIYGDLTSASIFNAGERIVYQNTSLLNTIGVLSGTPALYNAPSTYLYLTNTAITIPNPFVIGVPYFYQPLSADTIVYGTGSHSEGEFSVAAGSHNSSKGYESYAIGDHSSSEGYNTSSLGYASHAEGQSALSIGDYSHAEGSYTESVGDYSHAEGAYTQSTGQYSHAEGSYTQSIGNYSHAEGGSTKTNSSFSHSEGNHTTTGLKAYLSSSVITSGTILIDSVYGDVSSNFITSIILDDSISYNTYGIKKFDISSVTWNGTNTIIYLQDTTVSTGNSLIGSVDYPNATGTDQQIGGTSQHAEGETTLAVGESSHAEGINSISIGINSHAEGRANVATGSSSHAEGNTTSANADYSHTEGYLTKTVGNYSHAEGESTITNGTGSHAEGGSTTTYADYSHTEGAYTTTNISATFSHAEGMYTTTVGTASHAEGNYTQTNGDYSHAEGDHTTTSGYASHAEGGYNIAYSTYSHIGGSGSTVTGNMSFVHSTDSTLNATRSVILGGHNITGTTDDTVYVPYLNLNYTPTNNDSNTQILTRNLTTGNVEYRNYSTFGGGGISADTYVTGFTYNNLNRLTISRNGGQPDLNVYLNTFSGLTVNGNVTVNGNLTATTISTTLKDSLFLLTTPSADIAPTQVLTRNSTTGLVSYADYSVFFKDTFVTGFTYSNNNLTISRNQGQPSLNVTINNFTGLTVNGTLSATTYVGLPTYYVTGGTYSAGTLTLTTQGTPVSVTGLPRVKAGSVSAGSFTGTPRKATVTFTSNYPNTNYVILLTGGDNRVFTYESQTVSGFTINTNSNTALNNNVYWQTTPIGEY